MTEQKKQANICVVGSSNMDLISRIPRLPKMGETLVGHSFQMGCGGKGANQAVMAAKLGARVTMVTKIGRDPLGRITFDNFRKLGMDTSYVFFDEELFSGVAPIMVDDDGRNMIVIVPGANDNLLPADIRRAEKAIRSANILICQIEVPLETSVEAMRIAKDAGVRTIFNPAPARTLPQEIIELSDIIAPNETETEILTGIAVKSLENAEAAAHKLRDMGATVVIITMGEWGVLVVTEEGRPAHIPARKTRAVDTTGAGDAFIGTLAYFLALGKPLQEAIKRANGVAAISVTRMGTQTSFPARAEIEELINARVGEKLPPTMELS